ncbi:energy transducer TonB [uncultured Winogradskyella sp.]|uniref:energy transducer TonB n=1 Tax=uncultured Winogradskyella sp. TaxID=395353 RepID=UPI0030DC1068|tara:strand:+ start:59548 stop:60339 length:792 start_codon:yes stop_codon:yes gene_type:complete
MKNSKKDFGITGQSVTEVKKPHKHDANLQKNSSLYFQIGLILCLLGTYSLFEMQFQDQKIVIDVETASKDPMKLDYVKPFVVEVIKPKDPEPVPSQDLKDIFKIVKDDTPIVEKIINTPDAPKAESQPAKVGDINVFKAPEEDIIVPFIHIEKVPVYPGCEKYDTNDERRKCMSQKISKLVSRKFNGDIAEENGLSGKQIIQTQFTIDKFGNVIDIKTRAPHPALAKEAQRVINKIPKMQPGLQRNNPVGVIYTLPIRFMVRD